MTQDARDDAVPQVHRSTRHLPASEQYDAWRATMAPPGEFSRAPGVSAADGFPADRSIFDLGSVIVTTERSPAVSFEFGAKTARKHGFDHLFVGVIKSGGQSVETGDTATSTGPGSLVAFSMDQSRHGISHGLEGVGVCIPRGVYPQLAGIGTIALSAENSAMGRLLRDLLIVFGHHVPRLKATEAARATEALTLMIGACLEPSRDNLADAGGVIGHVIFEQARRHIKMHLSFPTLTVEDVCRAVGVSRAQLYRLFEPVGGVAREIRRQRLFAAHDALSNRADRRAVYQIANDLGFSSSDKFSRAFRREFGYSPKEAREEARTIPSWMDVRWSASSFESLLHKLGASNRMASNLR